VLIKSLVEFWDVVVVRLEVLMLTVVEFNSKEPSPVVVVLFVVVALVVVVVVVVVVLVVVKVVVVVVMMLDVVGLVVVVVAGATNDASEIFPFPLVNFIENL